MSDEQLINRLRDSRYLSQHHSFENVAALCEEAADRIKQLAAERDAALADNERLREGLAEMKQQLVEIMCKPEKMLLTPESVVKSIDTLLKEQP